VPPAELGELGGELPTLEPTIPDPPPPELPDSPPPPLIPPPPADPIEAAPEPFPGGPISEEKTFDEPVFDDSEPSMEPEKKSGRKAPSPFIVIGGALIIIIGLLYGALTYLKKDKPAPRPAAPPVSVSVPVPKPVPAPKPQPEAATTPATTPDPVVAAPVPKPEPKPAPKPEPAVTPAPAPKPAISTAASGQVQYSVQVGALILKSSVEELEKKLRVLGHDPFRKTGSTTAMMNMLTVGPFATVSQAQSALSRLKGAGVDSNVRRRADGGAVINAGSYLLEENANSVMKKVRSLGYPVRLSKSEAKLPMTFVRVGRYSSMGNASTVKDELRGKGFDAIVVKLK
jgi:cell division protein FtsN